jgi:hypothetical protein
MGFAVESARTQVDAPTQWTGDQFQLYSFNELPTLILNLPGFVSIPITRRLGIYLAIILPRG